MLDGDARCLESHLEAVGRRSCCKHYERAFAVASVERLAQVGLFGLGRKSWRWAAALHVDDNKRKLCHHSQSQTFALEGETRTGCRGHGKVACKRRSYCRAYSGYFVFHLASFHTEVLALCKLVQDVGCRGNRVAAKV